MLGCRAPETDGYLKVAATVLNKQGHKLDLVTASLASVPPDALNPRMILAGVPPELLVHKSSEGEGESVSFWKS
jgi:hypothetical protein